MSLGGIVEYDTCNSENKIDDWFVTWLLIHPRCWSKMHQKASFDYTKGTVGITCAMFG